MTENLKALFSEMTDEQLVGASAAVGAVAAVALAISAEINTKRASGTHETAFRDGAAWGASLVFGRIANLMPEQPPNHPPDTYWSDRREERLAMLRVLDQAQKAEATP